MNIIDKRKMLAGCLYNFDTSNDITGEEVDAIIAAREAIALFKEDTK